VTPYYEADGITIYHGDCRDILPTLKPVDLVVTDPPYNVVNRADQGLRSLTRGTADSTLVDCEWLGATLAAQTVGSVYVWCASEQLSTLRCALVDAGMSTRTCVWHKTNPSPMNGEVMWLSALEVCVFARHPKATFTLHCQPPIWTGPTEPRTDHPTAKPEWLFKRLILASSKPGDVVLDSYMGSGTSLVTAKLLGRRAIGVELEERYCEIAAKRLAQGVLDFGPTESNGA
jgi:site-specific DNA-methyltransferase (adenine-specific)